MDAVPIVITGEEIERLLQRLDVVVEPSLNGCIVDTRRVSDMKDFYFESAEDKADKIVYQILGWPEDGAIADLLVSITVLYPGSVGSEQFHTKGHFHNDPDGPEFVVGYKGVGVLQTGDRAGLTRETKIERGTHVWIPTGVAHRVINRSSEPVIYLSVSSATVGHDYDSVTQLGWKRDITKKEVQV